MNFVVTTEVPCRFASWQSSHESRPRLLKITVHERVVYAHSMDMTFRVNAPLSDTLISMPQTAPLAGCDLPETPCSHLKIPTHPKHLASKCAIASSGSEVCSSGYGQNQLEGVTLNLVVELRTLLPNKSLSWSCTEAFSLLAARVEKIVLLSQPISEIWRLISGYFWIWEFDSSFSPKPTIIFYKIVYNPHGYWAVGFFCYFFYLENYFYLWQFRLIQDLILYIISPYYKG